MSWSISYKNKIISDLLNCEGYKSTLLVSITICHLITLVGKIELVTKI